MTPEEGWRAKCCDNKDEDISLILNNIKNKNAKEIEKKANDLISKDKNRIKSKERP